MKLFIHILFFIFNQAQTDSLESKLIGEWRLTKVTNSSYSVHYDYLKDETWIFENKLVLINGNEHSYKLEKINHTLILDIKGKGIYTIFHLNYTNLILKSKSQKNTDKMLSFKKNKH